MDLMDLSALTQVLDDRKNFRQRFLQSLTSSSQAQLKSVVGTVDDLFVAFESLEDRRRIPVFSPLVAERQAGGIVGLRGHPDVVLFAHGNYVLEKIRNALPILV
jgi:hypothetical protein